MAMGALPGHVVGRGSKSLGIKRASRKREHRYWLTYPNAFQLQLVLPAMNLRAVVALGENQICLNPWDASASINQQFCDPVRPDTAIFVQVFTAFVRDRFNAAFHRNATGTAQKIQSFFIPEINARLKSN